MILAMEMIRIFVCAASVLLGIAIIVVAIRSIEK